ncbi:MAG: hypothetical protein LQ338_005611 [Usnochroma carphineum]|nr:MAG: hypothetical protein LQ338_005611 [Usnochroma carphineum]
MVAQAAKKKVLITCPSNAAADTLAAMIQTHAPHLNAVRFHSLHFEDVAMSREAAKVSRSKAELNRETKAGDDPAEDNSAEELEPETHRLREAYTRLVEQGLKLSKKLYGRTGRPNFRNMSLMARCLQACCLDGSPAPVNPHPVIERFRRVYLDGRNAGYGNGGYKKTFDAALKALQEKTLGDTSVVITTMSNAAEPFLAKHFFPDLRIADEVAFSTEPEMLIPWVKYYEHAKFLLGVGDPNQLRAVVTSFGVKDANDKLVNPFGHSLQRSLMERRRELGDSIISFKQTSRMTAGLEEPSSTLF